MRPGDRSNPRRLCTAALAGALLGLPLAAAAQAWPAKPVRLVVPFPPGGATDLLARQLAQRLGDTWGQALLVENRGGASGAIATEHVARQPGDGYTLLFATASTHAINPAVSKVPFHPIKDFTPVVNVAAAPLGLVVHPSLPARSVKELVALLRARPGQLDMASFGTGTGSHLAGELLKNLAKIDMLHVPYKGGGAALADLLGGQVQLMFATTPAAMPQVKAGRLRAVAVTTRARSQALPELPTMIESGVPGYEAATWYGLLAPAATPRAVIDRMHAETVKIIGTPDMREKLIAQGFEPVGSSPAEFAAYIQAQIETWAKVIRAAGLKS
jgi:tripartite-type tricarboxylate transporter receptor subunit TctC